MLKVQTPLMQSLPVPQRQPPGNVRAPWLPGGHVVGAQQPAPPDGTLAGAVHNVPPPPQTLEQQSLLELHAQPPSLLRALLLPLQPHVGAAVVVVVLVVVVVVVVVMVVVVVVVRQKPSVVGLEILNSEAPLFVTTPSLNATW